MQFRDDNQCITQVLKGDKASYAWLVDRYKDMVFTLAMRIAQGREDAEEITQDAFINAFKKLSSFKKEAKFSTWLYRIAYNEAISRVRKRKTVTMRLEEEITAEIAEQQVEEEVLGLDTREQKWVVDKLLANLPELDQALVTLFYLDEMPVSDISRVTGLSESNVKVRLHRIRKKIYFDLHEILKKKTYSFF